MAEAPRDNNMVTTLLGVSNVDGETPVVLWADPTTHRLLVSSTTNDEVWSEIPTGTINGANKDFVLAHTPSSGTLRVFVNGMRMSVTDDYTLSTATISFVTAPPTGSKILCDYNY